MGIKDPVACLLIMFCQGRLAMPYIGRENVKARHSAFRAQSVNVQATGAEKEKREPMSGNCGLLAIVSMIVSIVAGVPTAIRGWRDLIWKQRREDAIRDDDVSIDCDEEETMSGESKRPTRELPQTNGQKDRTVYSLDGEGHYGKGRLVLAVIKKYVSQMKGVRYEELNKAFPAQLRIAGNTRTYWGCVNLKSDAVTLFQETGRKRHFLGSEEIIKLDDGTEVAVSSQWGSGNIDAFIKKSRDLGFRIETVN